MITQCHECKGTVSTEAKTCPHCGAPVEQTPVSAPASMPEKRRTSRGLVGVLIAVIVIAGLIWWLFPPSSREATSSAAKTLLRVEQTLLDETFDVAAGNYNGYRIRLPGQRRVTVRLAVQNGSAVDLYLMDPQQKDELDKAGQKLFGGTFHYKEVLSRQSVRDYNDAAVLPHGEWFVIIRSTDPLPLLGKGQTSRVHLKVTTQS